MLCFRGTGEFSHICQTRLYPHFGIYICSLPHLSLKASKIWNFCVWNEKKTGVKSHHIPGKMCHYISLQLILKFKAVTAVLGLLDRLHCNKWFHTFRSLGEINRKRESFCTFFHCWGHKTLVPEAIFLTACWAVYLALKGASDLFFGHQWCYFWELGKGHPHFINKSN